MAVINVPLIEQILNASISINPIPYTATEPCFDWCVIQQVAHSNNMELSGLIFIIVAYLLIVFYEISEEITFLKAHREVFIYWAKLLLLMFFGFYFLIIRMRLLW